MFFYLFVFGFGPVFQETVPTYFLSTVNQDARTRKAHDLRIINILFTYSQVLLVKFWNELECDIWMTLLEHTEILRMGFLSDPPTLPLILSRVMGAAA